MSAPVEEIPDELLYAFVDGEADPAATARVEAAMARDPAVAARIARHRALRARLQTGFAQVLTEPVPARLQGAMRAPSRWALKEWAAMAATLVLGTLIGTLFFARGNELPVIARAGELIADRELAAALDSQLAGAEAAGGSIRIPLSIRTTGGELCRSFQLAAGQAGLACRRGADWVVDVLATSTPDEAEYRRAGSALPETVRMAIETRIAGEPLTTAEETAQRESRWQAAPVPQD